MTLLNSKNLDTELNAFMDDYQKATSIFNNFFGTLAMLAHDSLLEAVDLYEDTPAYRQKVKYWLKKNQEQWRRYWALVKFVFDDRYTLYMDYLMQTTKAIDPDVRKLHLALSACLANNGIKDNGRMAWLYVYDLLTHQMVSAFSRFVGNIKRETGRQRLADAFEWSNPQHTASISEELIKAVNPRVDIPISDNVELSMEIIAKHIMSHKYQDTAALTVLEYDDHKDYREHLDVNLDDYKAQMAAEEEAARRANEDYWRKKTEKKKKAREETQTAEHLAEQLSNKFKVTRL